MNFQGGDNEIPYKFYSLVFNFINENDKILNLGSGMKFFFEKGIKKKKNVFIESVDILSIEDIPQEVDKYTINSVEKPIKSKNKFDVVTFFEVIEHIDKTDILIENCSNNLKTGGRLIISFPNLSSLYARVELLLGYQPHILEISNKNANFGTGLFGKYNNPNAKPLHHIRGITLKAMKEMIIHYNFKIEKIYGYDYRFGKIFNLVPSMAPVNIIICKKK